MRSVAPGAILSNRGIQEWVMHPSVDTARSDYPLPLPSIPFAPITPLAFPTLILRLLLLTIGMKSRLSVNDSVFSNFGFNLQNVNSIPLNNSKGDQKMEKGHIFLLSVS